MKTTFHGDSGVMTGGGHSAPTFDYLNMPSESFGLAPVAPPAPPPPPATQATAAPVTAPKPVAPAPSPFGGGGFGGGGGGFGGGNRGNGFGGGSGPSVPFDEVEKNSKTDFSFFSSNRKKL